MPDFLYFVITYGKLPCTLTDLIWNFIPGYLPELLEVVNHRPIKDNEDDQLYYTKVYLNEKKRDKLKITLDHNAKLFQSLTGAFCE